MIKLSNLKIPLNYNEKTLYRTVCTQLQVVDSHIVNLRVLKKSVDARDKGNVHFVMAIGVSLNIPEEQVVKHLQRSVQATLIPFASSASPAFLSYPRTRFARRPVVVGLGPAGLFAAWTLAQAGACPLIIERGRDVEHRERDVKTFWNTGNFSPFSNVQFGEGGAGAFSDGKLTTGISDTRCQRVLELLYECGAPEEILYLAKPHIGTDKLPGVVRTLRKKIIALGGEVRFETRLEQLLVDSGRIVGASLVGPDGQEQSVETDYIVLAIGHSARDTFKALYDLGVPMIRKPFSIGARIEHSQKMIDHSQYGSAAGHPALGAADYKLSVKLPNGRSAYTFCMCPGGSVVAAASEEGGVVTNGMSVFARDGENANSALLIGVEPDDFGGDDPMAGVRFQRHWEELAYKLGGCNYCAPAQRVGDFLKNVTSRDAGDIHPTYLPGVTYTNLSECLPAFVTETMRTAIIRMDRQLQGFAYAGALLTGVETRSSSPLRILRDESCQSALRGLFPCGEGAGYAGGILSAAVDGMRVGEQVLTDALSNRLGSSD